MASSNKNEEGSANQTVPDGGEEAKVKAIQSHYLRCPSPSNFSMISESRFSMISGSDADSIFMEPIHLSAAIAAKQIINEELKPRGLRTESIPESMLETAEQLMVEDLYNRVKDMIDDRSPYNTPCVLDIQRTLVQDRLEAPFSPVDEVWPNIFIGEKSVAVNKARLKRMGITHILNAAHGTGVYTGEVFYSGMKIQYMGIEVDDFAETNISPHLRTAAEFLDEALLTHKGKVLVNSMMGVSRSAVLVTAYLMIFHHMTIMEALMVLRKKRAINPNEGFLKQLRQFNETLMEERDDDDDTLSQCSVIDNHVCVDGEESIMGVKAHSIMVEEEEDSASVMSSVASSAAAVELAQNEPDMQEMEKVMLSKKGSEEKKNDEDDDVDDVDSMIREWQRRNEKYQSEEWWEAQLLSESEEDGESHPDGGKQYQAAIDKDLESVTKEDIRVVKEKVKSKMRQANYDSMSTSSCSSYSDLWKQRLKEIEEQAAARYHKKQNNNNSESTTTEEENTLDDDVESVLSDTSSMYNFCKRNKEKLTPLERWRIKRIQFGWNKKDGEGEVGALSEGSCGGQAECESACTPALEDINLTAYQSWKLKQQKRLGEQNKDEIVELSRGEDSATIKRRQRRTELLERSKKTLEESQSISGWETESCFSGGTVPLSAFWTVAGVTGPPTIINDDNFSMLSGRSSVISQTRSTRSQPTGLPQAMAQVPIVPVSTVQGPSGEQIVNLASIQSWIANVVTETLIQKQGEINLPPSRSGSVLSFDRRSSILSGQCMNDDKTSMLSGASYSSFLSHGKGRAESVLSTGGASNLTDISGLGSRRNKITTTSVPLYSLFQDQVNMRKLDSMDKEKKSEMRDKMATYEVKKITEDNKRSTLYKKKKLKEEEDQEQKKADNLVDTSNRKKSTRSYGLSGRLNLSTVLERDKNTSIDEWLDSVRPPQRKQASTSADRTVPVSSNTFRSADQELTDYDLPIRRASYTTEELDENNITSRYQYRFQADRESSPDSSPEPYYPSRRSPLDTEIYSNVFKESNTYIRAGASNAPLEEDGDESKHEYSTKKVSNYSQYKTEETQGLGGREEREKEYDVAAFISQTRQRSRAQAAAEIENDKVIAAWREQQVTKSQSYKSSDES